MLRGNLADPVPGQIGAEAIETLIRSNTVRIERIISRGSVSPPGFWYDQLESECVLVVSGGAELEIEGQARTKLGPGDWINIPARVRHRVSWTDPTVATLWLAVFYSN